MALTLLSWLAACSTSVIGEPNTVVRDVTIDLGAERLLDAPWASVPEVYAVRDDAGACEPAVQLYGDLESEQSESWFRLPVAALVDGAAVWPVATAYPDWLYDRVLDVRLQGGAEGWLERSTLDRFTFVVPGVTACDGAGAACRGPAELRIAFTGHPNEHLRPTCTHEGMPLGPLAPSGLPWCGLPEGEVEDDWRDCRAEPWSDALLAAPPP